MPAARLEAEHGDLSAGPLVDLARRAKRQRLCLDHGAMTDVELDAQTVAHRDVFPREQATFQDRIGQRAPGQGAGCEHGHEEKNRAHVSPPS